MNFEFDDIDRALIEKVREAIRYDDEGDPVRDVVDEEDMVEAMRMLLTIIDAPDVDATQAAQASAEPVARIDRNESGQIRMLSPDGGPFDMSRFVGTTLYLHPPTAELTALRAQVTTCRDDVAEMKANYLNACRTIAAMHEAALGEVTGAKRGVVEDVADLRAQVEALRVDAPDAQRYRFLRDKAWGKNGALALMPCDEMDAAIDAQIAALAAAGGK